MRFRNFKVGVPLVATFAFLRQIAATSQFLSLLLSHFTYKIIIIFI